MNQRQSSGRKVRPLAQVLLRKLVLAYAFLALVILGVQLIVEYRNYRREIVDSLQTQANAFAPGAAAALWDYQDPILKSLANGIGLNPAVVFVQIVDRNGKPMASWSDPDGALVSPDLQVILPLFLTDLNGGRTGVGALTIASSEARLWDHLQRVFFSIALVGSLLLLSLGFVFWLLVQKWAVAPLSRFSAQVRDQVSSGIGQQIDLGQINVAEIGTLQDGFNSLMQQVGESHALIAEQNVSLEQKVERRTRDLESSLQKLRETQAQLIQAEKMASLGQLVANVAHEINTPIGAVKSSGKSIADALDRAIEDMPKLFLILDRPSRELFTHLVGHARQSRTSLSSREERAVRRTLTRELAAAGVVNADGSASILVNLGAQTSVGTYLPLLRHPEASFILRTADIIGSIISSTTNISTAVDRVAKIVTTLKSFSQTESSGDMTHSDLRDGIEEVITIYQPQLRQGTDLIRDFEEIAPLLCFPEGLKQVWTHLIHNALQAMSFKGRLAIGIHRVGDDVIVSFADSGSGIPDEVRGRIFEPFFTTRPTGEGSGLGLDIVKKIVEKHNGRIEVISKVGVGSTFSVYLPQPRIAG